jgi:hypothetical protein
MLRNVRYSAQDTEALPDHMPHSALCALCAVSLCACLVASAGVRGAFPHPTGLLVSSACLATGKKWEKERTVVYVGRNATCRLALLDTLALSGSRMLHNTKHANDLAMTWLAHRWKANAMKRAPRSVHASAHAQCLATQLRFTFNSMLAGARTCRCRPRR